MRSVIHIIAGIFVISAFAQCGNAKKTLSARPEALQLGDVVSEPWRTEGSAAAGTNLFIPVISGSDIFLDSVYYRGRRAKLEKVQRGNYLVYIGRFENRPKPDIVMHADPRKEVGNRPPEFRKPLPFELEEDEAVVSFKERDVVKYFRIARVKEGAPVVNPRKE
ncbi:hypothetical protein [Sinomicrobium sp. M5D2P17]